MDSDAIQTLLQDVTPGPWRVGPVDDCRVEDADGNEVAQIDGDYNSPDLWPKMEANARFIAAARDLVPALTAERDAQTARADAAEAEVARRLEMHECAMAERDDCIEDWSKAKKEIARLTAELDAMRAGQDALVAATYEVAEAAIMKAWHFSGSITEFERTFDDNDAVIRAITHLKSMTPSDATAALDAKLRAERNKALEDAADAPFPADWLDNPKPMGFKDQGVYARGFRACRAVILAMIEPEEPTNE